MPTLRLRISEGVFDKLMWLLSKFSKEEVEIINEGNEFIEAQKYLEKELTEIVEGKANFIELEAFEKRLENAVKGNEDSL